MDGSKKAAKQAEKQAEPTQAALPEKATSPKEPRFGASVYKGSLSEAEPAITQQMNEDGEPYILKDPDFPKGYAENTTTVSVSAVDKIQFKENAARPLDATNEPGSVDPLRWQSRAAMSMDGLLIPFSTSFVERNPAGSLHEYEAGEGERPGIEQNRLPPYEKPSNLIDYWHTRYEDPDVLTDVVTSATLNPFAKGHHISVLAQGEDAGNVDTRADSGGQTASPLGATPGNPNAASRPMALRGPLVLTGWGFNTEGKPVPNMKRDALERETNPRADNFGFPINLPVQLLEPNPSVKFLANHMGRIDQWKTGPVDLRWDDTRKVWVSPGMNKVYLSKATRCILPTGGPDGKNSWNFGVNNVVGMGRQYRNPCPSDVCKYDTYFPKSQYYPDIEIYDPEDRQWCGKCQVKEDVNGNPYVNCDAAETACVPFYDAIILRSMGHVVSGRNVKSDCGDKFRKTSASDPYSKRMGNPCHGWGSSFDGIKEYLPDKVEGQGEANEEYSEGAYSILYERIFIENPLSQGLMLGDSFLSYDTGRKITMTYMRSNSGNGCGKGGEAISVTESLAVHVILQAEFVGVEMVTNSSCEQGEWGACTRKVMVQGMTTPKDCGPDDDYPSTSLG
jgi:hypothetical protein